MLIASGHAHVAYCGADRNSVVMLFEYLIIYQSVAIGGTDPADEMYRSAIPLIKMETLSQHLKQAFNALEFANAGHLHALTVRLDQPERSVAAARAEHRDASAEHDTRSTAFSN